MFPTDYNSAMMDAYQHLQQQQQHQFDRLHHPHPVAGNVAMGEIRGFLGTPPQHPRMNHHQQQFARLVNPGDSRGGEAMFHREQFEGFSGQPMLPLDMSMQSIQQSTHIFTCFQICSHVVKIYLKYEMKY